ncbi:MAG: FAD-dependent oxidoreductase [Rubrivivax sp.]|nr:FAD-dependent oxidoreductase [Rubrivivax sp.]
MRIAIVGGGASGLITAWLLDRAHEVTLFERAPVLGGHIRTMGRNAPRGDLPAGVWLDAGVVEFSRENFPTVHRLFAALGVPLRSVAGDTAFHRQGAGPLYSPGALRQLPAATRAGAVLRLARAGLQRARFMARANVPDAALRGRALGEFLGPPPFGHWLRLLVTYAYSMPSAEVPGLSAALCVPMLRAFARANSWSAVEGGTYAYVERLLAGLRGTVYTNAIVQSIRRDDRGVHLVVDGQPLAFDAVVIATPPDQVLRLLADADEAERRRFGAWRANHVTTLVHADDGLYRRRGVAVRTEFDLFEQPGGGGYNAWLNGLAGLPPGHAVDYGLALGLDAEIDPARVLLRQPHHTAAFTVAALAHRDEVRASNGQRRTWHVGAWLGDGLHEGAAGSALAVATALGGRGL